MSRIAFLLGLSLLIIGGSAAQAHPHRYSNSGYGYPAQNQAGYGQPAYGQPAYAPPGYGQPAYHPQAYGRPNFGPPQGGYGGPASAYRLPQESINGGGRLSRQADQQPSLWNGPPQGQPPGGYVGAPAGYGSFAPHGGGSCGPGCNHNHGH